VGGVSSGRPLLAASSGDHKEIAQILLEKDAEPTEHEEEG
jgi:hypothetical protein